MFAELSFFKEETKLLTYCYLRQKSIYKAYSIHTYLM